MYLRLKNNSNYDIINSAKPDQDEPKKLILDAAKQNELVINSGFLNVN